jgi:tetratricopeptide (TPR) repeat protein
MYTKCLNIYGEYFNDKNYNFADVYSIIGTIYTHKSKLSEALEMYIKGLNIQKAHYGDNNFKLAYTYSHIGHVYEI